MARLDNMPRTRRRRAAGSIGAGIALIGGTLAVTAVRAGAGIHPVMVVGLVIMAAGVALLVWGTRGHATAEEADRRTLVREGRWDGLPAGTFEEDGRIGLRSQKLWTRIVLPVLGVLMLLLGGVIALASEGDTEMLLGGCGVMALGLLMFSVVYATAGTVYWLDPDGVSRERWPRRRAAWSEIADVTVHRNRVLLGLQDSRRAFVISAGVLEISTPALVQLLTTLRAQATR
ncbi:hypothetical protein [Ornithinimicrobium cavernae]|uniref:hypothetical protein n=1 Tax=Ornithinimicrobium cavernae TaxID=2666047 RepID=UPI000D69E3BC|nr:hypothetical protein [Ornithinimicrobium cavernae]